MSSKKPLDALDLLNIGAKQFMEGRLGVKLTNAQFKAVLKIQSELNEEAEVNEAISLLESRGYTVTKD